MYISFYTEDGRLMADAETGEFWGFFGGFAPLPRKTAMQEDNKSYVSHSTKLMRYFIISSKILISMFGAPVCLSLLHCP